MTTIYTIQDNISKSLELLIPKMGDTTPMQWDVWERTQSAVQWANRADNRLREGCTVTKASLDNLTTVMQLIKQVGCTEETCGENITHPYHLYMHFTSVCINPTCEDGRCGKCIGGVMNNQQRLNFVSPPKQETPAPKRRRLFG